MKSAKSRKVYTKVSDRSNRCGYRLTRAGTIHPPSTKYPKRPRSYNSFKEGEFVVEIKNTEALGQTNVKIGEKRRRWKSDNQTSVTEVGEIVMETTPSPNLD